MNEPCPVCEEPLIKASSHNDLNYANCPLCGEYRLTRSVFKFFRTEKPEKRVCANISGWLRENKEFEINSSNLDNLCRQKTPSFHERADKILLMLEKKTTYIGEYITRDKSWISIGWCINENEIDQIVKYLEKSVSRIACEAPVMKKYRDYHITPNGWEYLEKLKKINADSEQGFVAMWFDNSLDKIYNEIITTAIFDAGYKPHRVDQREHNDKIDDEIISEIRKSRFVLADFTGHRGGVYYEAGFAKGLGMEVFWTCRKDEIDKLHFDIRQYNCIEWEQDKLEDFKKRITLRIESVIGSGSYKKNQ